MEHQLRPPRGFVDIFNPFSLKILESHTVNLENVLIEKKSPKETDNKFIKYSHKSTIFH